MIGFITDYWLLWNNRKKFFEFVIMMNSDYLKQIDQNNKYDE